jgi:uncharacterized membrane protein SpoIIM required for sporulation
MLFEASNKFEITLLALAGLFLPVFITTKIYVLYHKKLARHDKSKYKFQNLKQIIALIILTLFLYIFCMNHETQLFLGIMSCVVTFLFFAANFLTDYISKH